VIRNTAAGIELVTMRWGMPPPSRMGGAPFSKSATRRRRIGAAG